MPTKFAMALASVLAVFLFVNDGGEQSPTNQANIPVRHGLERVDSVLQRGLSQNTHDAISEGLSGSIAQSAEFLKAVKGKVAEVSE